MNVPVALAKMAEHASTLSVHINAPVQAISLELTAKVSLVTECIEIRLMTMSLLLPCAL